MGGAGRDWAQLSELTRPARRCVALSDLIGIVDGRSDLQVCLRELRDRRHRRQPAHIERSAREIVEHVVAERDAAVVEYTRRFDCPTFDASQLVVRSETIQAAYDQVPSDWVRAYRRARENVLSFHERQLAGSWLEEFDGMLLGERLRPVASTGVHVPGFTAALFATVAMCVEPARAAGVERVVVATPPRKDGAIDPLMLVACAESGADEIYRMGGAQAIAALAYGTATVAPVDLVVGPGNPYTMAAKRMVFG
ncbi:MAG: histidinol dehydrogenase, partial [Armatimonadota bacterium]